VKVVAKKWKKYIILGKRKWRRRAHRVRGYYRHRHGKRELVHGHLRRNRIRWRL